MKKENSTFKRYINLIDEVEVGASVTRQYVILMLDLDQSSTRTVDTYQRLLENACFLEYKGLGLYEKVRALDHSIMSTAKLKAENVKFYNALGVGLKWVEKTAEDIERAKRARRWKLEWKRSGLNADDFILRYSGKITGEKFGL